MYSCLWVVDSGACAHFSDELEDFGTLDLEDSGTVYADAGHVGFIYLTLQTESAQSPWPMCCLCLILLSDLMDNIVVY